MATHFARRGFATAFFGKAHFASYFPDFPTGRVESVPDSGSVPPEWHGPYFGFEHVELVTDVHNIRHRPAGRTLELGIRSAADGPALRAPSSSATAASAASSGCA